MKNGRKTLLRTAAVLLALGIIGFFSNDEVGEDEIGFVESEAEENLSANKEEPKGAKGIEENAKLTSEDFKESEVNSLESIDDNTLPKTEEYVVNNTLIEYNKIAEYPIDDEFIKELIEIERPLRFWEENPAMPTMIRAPEVMSLLTSNVCCAETLM